MQVRRSLATRLLEAGISPGQLPASWQHGLAALLSSEPEQRSGAAGTGALPPPGALRRENQGEK